TKYIHVIAPCPVGWGARTDATVDLAREIVDTGLWPLAEYEDGRFRLTRKRPPAFADLERYFRAQSRFRHLTDEDLARIAAARDLKWEKIEKEYER
ncbi:MAG: pyruvate synthase subunit beta, partial [Clostridiales Family XIII bacterium]|nr:pyruvate synthase subunit beta [Clostridiales Family XIII bacterium]